MDEQLEATIRGHLDAGAFDLAAETALRGYGAAVYRFLLARTHDDDRANEAFAQLGEDLWRGIESFRGQSSFATWMYTLARNAACRLAAQPHNRARRHTTTSKLREIIRETRERTAPHLRTDVKDRFRTIRESMSPEERELLHLRVDRDLAWVEIARIVEGDEALADQALERASARVRKRFSALKKKLAERAMAEGLLDESGG